MRRIKMVLAVAMAVTTLLALAATPAMAQGFFGDDAFVEEFGDDAFVEEFGDDFDEDDFDEDELENCELVGFEDEFTGEALVLCEVDLD